MPALSGDRLIAIFGPDHVGDTKPGSRAYHYPRRGCDWLATLQGNEVRGLQQIDAAGCCGKVVADAHARNTERGGNSVTVEAPGQIGHLHAIVEYRAGDAEAGARDRLRRAAMHPIHAKFAARSRNPVVSQQRRLNAGRQRYRRLPTSSMVLVAPMSPASIMVWC